MLKNIIGLLILTAFLCFTTMGYAENNNSTAMQSTPDKVVTVEKAPADKASKGKKVEPTKKNTSHKTKKPIKKHPKTTTKVSKPSSTAKPATAAQEKTTK